MARQRKPSFMDELMAEPIRMPGCPGLIVTRGDAYQWFKRAGWDMDQRTPQGRSVDRMVFLPAPVDEPLSEPEFRDRVFAYMAATEA